MEIPDDIRKDLEEMNVGVQQAIDEFADIQKRGLLKELQRIVHDDKTYELIQHWIDMTVILGIKNNYISMRSPMNFDDESMIIDGNEGIRDLILKGFLYGLYWKTKSLEVSKLDNMWNVGDCNG